MATVLVQCIIISFGATVMFLRASVVWLMGALVLASIVNFSVAAILARKKLGYRLFPAWQPEIIKKLLKMVPAFAFAVVFVKIYNVIDPVLLGLLASDEAVAFYAIPAKVVTSVQQIVPAALAAVIFPIFTQHYRDHSPRLSLLFEQSCAYLLVVSVPAALGIATLAPKILQVIWPHYANAATTFRVMALALPFIFLSFPTGYLLNACDRQVKNTFNRGKITLATVIGNIVLIPYIGYFGSGLVFLGSNCLLLALDSVAVRSIVRPNLKYLSVILVKVALASSAMLAMLWILRDRVGLPTLLAVGGITYLGGMLVQRVWKLPRVSG